MLALYIILGILLFLLVILSLPVNVYAEYKESFVLAVRWLFIKIYIYPPADKKKKKPKKEKKPKEEKPKEETPPEENATPAEPKENFIKTFYNNQGVTGILELISNIAKKLGSGLKGIGRSFYIRRLWLRINVGDGNSANTAIKYGKMCSKVYPAMGYILSVVHSKNCSVKVQPDFLGGKTEGAFSLHLAVIPSKLIGAAIVMGIKLVVEIIKVFISNAKNQPKAVKTENTAPQGTDNNNQLTAEADASAKKGGTIQ
ncbi:MAG: DUF2953 domain-containing protein [Clostridia bacterium]|nr:DUF2953 domain-containing protein [Clostridia bacterium]